jgi:superfamily II DNA/RNA helicase
MPNSRPSGRPSASTTAPRNGAPAFAGSANNASRNSQDQSGPRQSPSQPARQGSPAQPRQASPSQPGGTSTSPSKRGRNAARANAARKTRGGGGGQGGAPQNQEQRPKKAAVDLFSSFESGTPPNLEASFAELGVPAVLVRALNEGGIEKPFPIQAATMADCLAGRDVLGRGRTGSGKTLAFVLPVLTRLAASTAQRRPGRPRALILVPTRELAIQINTMLAPLAKLLSLRSTTIFGGVGPVPQINALRQGVDIVIACPGRLDDHIMGNHARLDAIEITVLDEADHMADMGFLPVVKKLLDQTPQNSQRLLFSATLDNGIDTLVNRYLHNPILRSVDPVETVEVKMTHHVFAVGAEDRFTVLRDLAAAPGRVIVFTRTKHGAKKLTRTLISSGVPTVELQGNLSQNVRTRNLEAFRSGEASALVATDIAARGIHVDDVALVVHFDPPVDHKAYLHRSGRTARAGAEGTVITMMLQTQTSEVKDLTRKAGIDPTVTRVTPDHPILQEIAPGERVFVEPAAIVEVAEQQRNSRQPRSQPSGRPSSGRPSQGRPSGAQPNSGRSRGQSRSR